jgi:heme A synthase
VAATRAFPRGHAARLGAALAVVFTITEALVGAGLVKFGLVAKDDSAARAVVMAIHLVNTSLLTAALALTTWAATGNVRAASGRGGRGCGSAGRSRGC